MGASEWLPVLGGSWDWREGLYQEHGQESTHGSLWPQPELSPA